MRCGTFELVERVGRGAAGEVWRARHRQHRTAAAVKLLALPSDDAAEAIRSAFHREIRAQARLTHPSIAAVLDYGVVDAEEADAADGALTAGAPYMAMELAEAGTLADTLLPPDWRTCREILFAVLDALAYAHARGVLHRDLKPENILRFPEAAGLERWKLADFGLAVSSSADQGPDEWTSYASAGTPEYMPPEQLDGHWRRFGPWTDLYQLGCFAFELVAGHLPYEGESFEAVAQQHHSAPIPSASEARIPVPDGVDRWLERLLAKSPVDRFRRAADAAHQLAELPPVEPIPDTENLGDSESDLERKRRELHEAKRATRTLSRLYPVSSTHRHDERNDGDTADEPETARPVDLDRPACATDLPDTWRRSEEAPRRQPADLGGLELFALRDAPLVDRLDERDRLWETLREVVDTRTPRGLVLEGAPGLGSSRLAKWAARRSHAAGACITLRAPHENDSDTSAGLTEMVRGWLAPHGLSRGACARLAYDKLAAYPRPGDAETGNRRDLAAGLTELLYPTPINDDGVDGPPYYLETPREQFALIHRLLERLSTRRSVLLWLDDLHLGPRTVSFVEFLFEHLRSSAVFVVATIRRDPPPTAVDTYERIQTLCERDDLGHLSISPLDPQAERTLIEQMLPLTPELTDRIQQRTEGHPLFVLQLLDDWATRRLLEPTDEGFALIDDADDALPESLYEVWRRRLDDALASHAAAPASRRQAYRSLELAAVLGERISPEEWHHVRRRADLPRQPALIDELVDRGLVVRERDTWRFTHRMLVEALHRRAERHDRLRELHRICAASLEEHSVDPAETTARRRATHWARGERPEKALDPLLTAARSARVDHGELEHASGLLEERRELIERAELPSEDRTRAEQWLEEAWTEMHLDVNDRVDTLAERAEALADAHDWDEIRGEANLVRARLANDRGRLEASSEYLDCAEAAFERLEDDRALARCLRFRGHMLRRNQQFDRAERSLRRASRYYTSLESVTEGLWCEWGLARVRYERGDMEAAKSDAQELLVRADQAQHPPLQAAVCNLLGDIARQHRDWEAAADYFERARRVWRKGSPKHTLVAELNLALTALGREDWETARTELRRLGDDFTKIGWETFLPHVHLGLAACAARAADWPSWTTQIESAEFHLESFTYRDRDFPQLAERIAELCLDADVPSRAARAYRLAVDLWSEFDADDQRRRVEQKLEQLDAPTA